MAALDTQQVELVGRNLLVGALIRDGLEVALPERDRGVDLIVYVDLDETGGPFLACPVQLKASSGRGFGLARKYAKFDRLLLAYVWHVAEPDAVVAYCLTYPEALSVAEAAGWTSTASWRDRGTYTTTRPSQRLSEQLAPYRMVSGAWAAKVRDVAAG